MSQTTTPLNGVNYQPWNRFGMRRVYVSDGDTKLGWFDPETREATADSPEHALALNAAAQAWVPPPARASSPQALGIVPSAVEPSPPGRPDRDLAANLAGGHAQAKADELLAAKSWLERTMDRYLMRKTESEAWRRGALGERRVGKILDALGPEWHVLHGVPAGPRGADIDHVLIGPPGVFTINTKNHARAPVTVTPSAVYTGKNYRTDYLAKARKEAALAGAKLGTDAFPIVCIIPDTEGRYTEKGQPQDVLVVRSHKLSTWLSVLLPKLEPDEVERLWQLARRSSTWEG